MRVVVLAGGVGAAKFLQGLQKTVSPRDLSCVVNTGDDFVLHGLHISPDLDIVTYTLAGVVDYEKGWGIHGDTFHCLESLKSLGSEEWFGLGDKDLATHLRRTELLSSGLSLSEVTTTFCQSFGVESRVLPMTNDRFETWIGTDAGWMHFEEYYVRRAFRDKVTGLELRGVDSARPAPGVVETLSEADLVIVAPSNPIVSIGTILAVRGIREALRRRDKLVIAISPIIGGSPLKGPADKLMSYCGVEVSPSCAGLLIPAGADRGNIRRPRCRSSCRLCGWDLAFSILRFHRWTVGHTRIRNECRKGNQWTHGWRSSPSGEAFTQQDHSANSYSFA